MWVKFQWDQRPQVVKNREEVGQLPGKVKATHCKKVWAVTSRFVADDRDHVYYIDADAALVRHRWSDILAGEYDLREIVGQQVLDFGLRDRKPAILRQDGTVRLPGTAEVDMHHIRGQTQWSVIESVGGRAVVGGSVSRSTGGLFVLGGSGIVRGFMEVELYHNGWANGRPR